MSIGAALSGLVNGFVEGRNVRNSWDDRKITNKRNERLDQLREEQNRRAEESHDMDMETSGLMNTQRRQAIRLGDQDWSDSQAMRAAGEADLALAEQGLVEPPPALEPARVSTSGMPGYALGARPGPASPFSYGAAAPQGIASTLTSQQYAQPAIARAAPGREDIQAALRAATAPARDTARGPAGPALGAAPSLDDLTRRAESLTAVAMNDPAYVGAFDRGQPRQPAQARIMPNGQKIVGGAILPPPVPEGGFQPTPEQPYEWGREGRALEDLDRAGTAVGKTIGDTLARTGEIAVNAGVDAVRRINAPFQAASRYATGTDRIGAPERVDTTGDGKREGLASSLPDLWTMVQDTGAAAPRKADQPKGTTAPAAAADASPQEQAVAEGAAKVVDAVTQESPGMFAAFHGMPVNGLGASPNTPLTQKQRERGGKTLMESYVKTGAPNTVKELLRQGRIEDAQRFDAWVKDGRSQQGLEAWGRGLFAAMQGDIDGAADNLMDAYNSAGYFDDGYQVDKAKSALIRDKTGEVRGVRLALIDQRTGQTVVQEDSVDGFIQKALWITSPEKAFAASVARMQATQDAMIEAQKKQQEQSNAAAMDLIKGEPARIATAAKSIYEASVGLDGKPTMSFADALAEAQRAFSGQGAVPAGAVPVARAAP